MKVFVFLSVIWAFWGIKFVAAADQVPQKKPIPVVPAKAEPPKPEVSKIPKIETLSSLKLISIDQQIFVLHEDQTSWGVVPAISFAKGERVQRTFPAPVKDWQNWRDTFLQMMSSFPKAKNCPHTISFQAEEQGENFKDKEVCLDELNSKQRQQLEQITKAWSKFLYGT